MSTFINGDYMLQDHNVLLLESDMREIINIAKKIDDE